MASLQCRLLESIMTSSSFPSAPTDDSSAPYRPTLLVVLLVVNAALVALVGYMIGSTSGSASHDPPSGIKLGALMTVPYLAAAGLSWMGKGQFGYGLAKGLAIGGVFVWGVLLAVSQGLSKVGAPGSGNDWQFYVIASALIGLHIAIIVLARAAAIRTLGWSSFSATEIGFIVACAWLLLALTA